MISIETWAEIRRRFYVEHHTINAISCDLGIHHSTVRRAINAQSFIKKSTIVSRSQLEHLHPLILDLLERSPKIRATRLFDLLKERDFKGSIQQLRRYVRKLRPQKTGQVFSKLAFFPGEQAQCDWASCGKLSVHRALRPLSLFVMVLSFSRKTYARFTFEQNFESFAREHVRAFMEFGGVPRMVLYDNLKTAVVERFGNAINFSQHLAEVAGYYHFRMEATAVRYPQSKGRVERAIGYLRTSFLPLREFKDLADANEQLSIWLKDVAELRSWPEDRSRSVREAFIEEKEKLLPLPEHPLELWATKVVRAIRWPYVRFDSNEYEVPEAFVAKALTLKASDEIVRILDGETELISYPRSFAKGETLTLAPGLNSPRQSITKQKHHLLIAIPELEKLFAQLVALNEPLRFHIKMLGELLSQYGSQNLRKAVQEAIEHQTPRAESVAQILSCKDSEPVIPILLPDRPGVRQLTVKAHDLADYDRLYTKPQTQEEIYEQTDPDKS